MYRLYVDGSYSPEDRKIGVGILCETKDYKLLFEVGRYKKVGVSHEAEYLAVKEALTIAQDFKMDNIEILSDFDVLVNNLTEKSRSNVDKFVVRIYESIIVLKSKFKNVKFDYIPTSRNKAHLLAYNASKKINKEKYTTLFHNLVEKTRDDEVSLKDSEKEVVFKYIQSENATEKKIIQYNDSKLDKDVVAYINKNNQEILTLQNSMNKLIADNQIVTRLLNSNMNLKQQLQNAQNTMNSIEEKNYELKNINNILIKERDNFQNTIMKIQQNSDSLNSTQSEVKNFIDAQNKFMDDFKYQMEETIKKSKSFSDSSPVIITAYTGPLS